MAKYIDADKMLKEYERSIYDTTDLAEMLYYMPAADVQEVRHGRWIIDEWNTPNCSVCGCSGIDDYYATPYCPHCGAKMDEVEANA